MNIKKLKEGQFIKNYRELCNILEIKQSTGQKKINQLDELSFYVDYTRGINLKGEKGNGFMINKIISIEYEPIEKQYKYYNDIRDTFLGYWLNNEASNYYYKKDLFAISDMCNINYYENIKYKGKHSKETDIDINTVADFFNVSNRKMSDILFNSLRRMYNSGFLKKLEKSYQVKSIDEDGIMSYRVATEEEIEEIGYSIYVALEEYKNSKIAKGFGDRDNYEIIKKYDRKSIYDIPQCEIKEFTDYTMKILNKTYPNIEQYFPCYLVKFNEKTCNRYLNKYEINENSNMKINDTICSSLLKTFEKNSIMAIEGRTPKSYRKYEEVRKNNADYIKLVEINIRKEG